MKLNGRAVLVGGGEAAQPDRHLGDIVPAGPGT